MGQTSDFIRRGHGVAFNNGLHDPRVDKRRERIIYQEGIHTDEWTEELTDRQVHIQTFNWVGSCNKWSFVTYDQIFCRCFVARGK